MSSASPAMRSHQPFACSVCHKRFTRHENLKRHASVHGYTRDAQLLACHACRVTFSRSDLQHRHMKRKHPETASRRHDCIISQDDTWQVPSSPQSSDMSSPPEHSASALFFPGSAPFATLPRAETGKASESTISRQASTVPTVDLSRPAGSFSWQISPAKDSEPNTIGGSFPSAWSIDPINDDCIADPANEEHLDLGQIDHGLQLYFSRFAPLLPFIHQATFDSEMVTECLLLAMLAVGLHHDDSTESINEASHCYSRALKLLDQSRDEDLRTTADALLVVQSLLLLEFYAILFLCAEHSSTGLRLHARIIALSRSARLLQGEKQQDIMGRDLDAVWRSFVFEESHKRTMLAVHQVDALWYHFLSVPRSLSHLEIKHKLPCSTTDWNASSAADWAYTQLTKRANQISSSMLYPDVIRSLLTPSTSPTECCHDVANSDLFGLTNFAHFALSRIREISGWSTITGCVSMDRVEPLKAALMSVAPLSRSHPTPTSTAFQATGEMAMIDLHIWSVSHTGGVVHSSIDAALRHATDLAVQGDLVLNAEIVATIRPHVDWFLRYLEGDAASQSDHDPPWITLFAYRVFLLAWQCLRQGLTDVVDVVVTRHCDEVFQGAAQATKWARTVMKRRGRQRWRYCRVILNCLETLEAAS